MEYIPLTTFEALNSFNFYSTTFIDQCILRFLTSKMLGLAGPICACASYGRLEIANQIANQLLQQESREPYTLKVRIPAVA